MVSIVPPSLAHAPEIEALLDHAFGPDRRAKTSYRYRDAVTPVASLARVALAGEALIGSIQYWPARLGHETVLLLGPIALWAGYVGQGVGSCLMHASLAAATAEGWRHVFLVGDPKYYSRFGFRLASRWGVAMPNEDQARFQGRCLTSAVPPSGDLVPLRSPRFAAYREIARLPLA
jgi:predicted N-acetyltransferase YhbS